MNVRRYDSNIHEFYSDDCHANVFIRTAHPMFFDCIRKPLNNFNSL